MKRRRLHCGICILCILLLLYGIRYVSGRWFWLHSAEAAVRRMERKELYSSGEILAKYADCRTATYVLLRHGEQLSLVNVIGGKYGNVWFGLIPCYWTAYIENNSNHTEFFDFIVREHFGENPKVHIIIPAPDENAVSAILDIDGLNQIDGYSHTWTLTAQRNPDGYYDFCMELPEYERSADIISAIGWEGFVYAPDGSLVNSTEIYTVTGTLALLDEEQNNLEIRTLPMIYEYR